MLPPADVMVVIPVFNMAEQPERTACLDFVRARLKAAGLTDVVNASAVEGSRWSKSVAINRAVTSRVADGTAKRWVWIHDADVVLPFAEIMGDLDPDETHAIQPFAKIVRLSREQTAEYMASGRVKIITATAPVCDIFGGGSVLMRTDSFIRARGFDEQFSGWGGEDVEFGERVATLFGDPVIVNRRGVHLWHPPVPKGERLAVRAANEERVQMSRNGMSADAGRWLVRGVESGIRAAPEVQADQTGSWAPFRLTPNFSLPSEPRLVVACVCKLSRRYTPEVVKWLRRQVAARLRFPHKFVCLTDRPELVPGGVRLKHDWPGYWSKLELFAPGVFADGDLVLYLDLDTVFTGDITLPEIPRPGDMSMVVFGPAWWTHYGSGIMVWRAPLTAPYDAFLPRAQEAMAYFPSDQEFIMAEVFRAGGRIRKFRGAEVQPHNGTGAVPESRPAGPVWCAAGSGLKPWEMQRPWIPPARPPEIQQGMAMIVSFFGAEAGPLVDAGAKGLARLQGLSPRPAAAILAELSMCGHTRFPGWTGERMIFAETERHAGLWQKENLWNAAARKILRERPDVTKLLFVDADTSPVDGEEDWLAVIAEALERNALVHPWTWVRESVSSDGPYASYSAQRTAGLKECKSGQGFAVAMTRKWFESCGGWPSMATAGSGDAVACLCWDAGGGHAAVYLGCVSMETLVARYSGPKTKYGFCGGELVHQYHGDRSGAKQTRNYGVRHFVWDMVKGPWDVSMLDENGLLVWRDTPLARAVRRVVLKRPQSRAEVQAEFARACAEEGVTVPPAAGGSLA